MRAHNSRTRCRKASRRLLEPGPPAAEPHDIAPFDARNRRPVTITVPDRPASLGSSGFLIEV